MAKNSWKPNLKLSFVVCVILHTQTKIYTTVSMLLKSQCHFLLRLDIILYVMGELANMEDILLDCISHVFLTIFIPQ